MIIYKTTNLINGKIYIGKQCRTNRNYLGSGKLLKEDIEKYGDKNFKKETLEFEIKNRETLCEREIYWIEFYNSTNPDIGYNLTKGGKGSLGLFPSKESRKKMSNAQTGRRHSEETKEKIALGNRGKVCSIETKQKISESMTGKHQSESHRAKTSASLKKFYKNKRK